jgi:excisionase family DNA binding protein
MNEKKVRELWTFDELLAYLKMPRTTVYLHISRGLIPSIKVGRHRRFIPDEVERALRRLPA